MGFMTGKSVSQRLTDSQAMHLNKQPGSSVLATKLAKTSWLYGCLLTRKSEKMVSICLS
jgi:hypothetical protein